MTDALAAPEPDDRGEPRWLRWVDTFTKSLAAIAALVTAVMMLNIVVDVIGRVVFHRALPGTLDVTQHAWMPTLVSLALGYALLRGEHLRVSLLTGPTGPRVQRVVEIVGMAFTLVVVGFFIWFGFEKAVESFEREETAVATQWLTIWPFRAALVVGLIGLFLQSAAQLVRAVTVKEFVPSDEAEALDLLEHEKSVLDEIGAKPTGQRVGSQR